jgi:glycosyltransferase involved in cell wall biosynthesis
VQHPVLTIGITCYNEGDWLTECWNSVLDQTDERWLAVMVLDGTEDARTIAAYDRIRHPRLQKFRATSNLGPYPTTNTAFRLTSTDFHFCLAADDQLMPDSVASVLNAIDAHPDADIVYGDYAIFGARQECWKHPRSFSADDLVERQCIPGASAYRTSLWRTLGGFSDELARGNGDYDFIIGAIELGAHPEHCGKTIYRYRTGHASVSHSYDLTYHHTSEAMIRRHPRFFASRRRQNRFRRLGFERAARANYMFGDRRTAAILALAALRSGAILDASLWKLFVRAKLPAWALPWLRRLRSEQAK